MRTLTPEQALGCATRSQYLAVPGPSIEVIADRIVGLHNTSQVTPYLSMRARMASFERADLDAVMFERWQLARFRAMRHTMFIFPVDLLEIAAAASRHIAEPLAARWLRDSGLTEAEFIRLGDAVLEALADGPLTSRQLRRELAVPKEVILPSIVSRLCDAAKVVGGAPPGSWRSNVRRFHLWTEVLPGVDVRSWSEDAAVAELVRRYVAGYGPVTLADVAWWTGFTKSRGRQALAALGEEIEEVAVDGWPGPLYLQAGAEVTVASDDVKALPMLDPYVQGYRDRVRFLDDDCFNYVYDGGGNSSATVVHGGRIIGVWQPILDPPSIRFHVFPKQSKRPRHDIADSLNQAARTLFDQSVDLVETSEMTPLTGPGGSRSAAHPLDNVLHRAGKRK